MPGKFFINAADAAIAFNRRSQRLGTAEPVEFDYANQRRDLRGAALRNSY